MKARPGGIGAAPGLLSALDSVNNARSVYIVLTYGLSSVHRVKSATNEFPARFGLTASQKVCACRFAETVSLSSGLESLNERRVLSDECSRRRTIRERS